MNSRHKLPVLTELGLFLLSPSLVGSLDRKARSPRSKSAWLDEAQSYRHRTICVPTLPRYPARYFLSICIQFFLLSLFHQPPTPPVVCIRLPIPSHRNKMISIHLLSCRPGKTTSSSGGFRATTWSAIAHISATVITRRPTFSSRLSFPFFPPQRLFETNWGAKSPGGGCYPRPAYMFSTPTTAVPTYLPSKLEDSPSLDVGKRIEHNIVR